MSSNPPKRIDAIVTLEIARSLLAKTGGWTQGELARDKWGSPVHPLDPNASRFCMLGAITCSLAGRRGPLRDECHRALAQAVRKAVEDYNDAEHTTKRKVLAMFDKAIERLRAEP